MQQCFLCITGLTFAQVHTRYCWWKRALQVVCVQCNNQKTAFWDLKSFANIIITSWTLLCLFFSGMDPCWDSAETQVQFPGGMCLHLRCHSSGSASSSQSLFPMCYGLNAFLSRNCCTEAPFPLHCEQHTRGNNLVCCSLAVSPLRGGCSLTAEV